MRFDLEEQQVAFGDSARKLFAEIFTDKLRRSFADEPALGDRWAARIAGDGLLAILASEEVGGLGLGPVDALPVVIEAGKACAPFPLTEGMLAAAATSSALPVVAAEIAEGRSLATIENLGKLDVRPERDGKVVLSGECDFVLWGGIARWLVGPAILPGGEESLIVVDLDACERTAVLSLDRMASAARIKFDGVKAVAIGADASRSLARQHLVLASAELLGLARYCFHTSTEYALTREQFGKQIGANQAIKHSLATMATKHESMTIAVQYAAWATDTEAFDAELARLSANTYCAEAARSICEDAIQLHGGIGFTWDLGLHLYLRRAVRLAATLGTTSARKQELARLLRERVGSGRGLHA